MTPTLEQCRANIRTHISLLIIPLLHFIITTTSFQHINALTKCIKDH